MRRVPSIPTSALRDYSGSERVERIWKRVQPDLLGGPRVLARPSRSIWIPAALAAVFVAGVFVGRLNVAHEREPTVSAERPVAPEPLTRAAAAPEQPSLPAEQPRTPQARKSHALDSARPAELGTLDPVEAPQILQTAPAEVPEWERLATDDKIPEALAAIDAHGGFSSVVATASASQLMTLVDIARSTPGKRDQAILALRRFVEAFPSASGAPEAALTLGNLLKEAGDGAGADDAYELYRRLSPGGDFAEDALARRVESALAQGNLEKLARLVAQYENDFPNGPRLEEFRAELAKRGSVGPALESGSAAPTPTASHGKEPVPADAPKPPSN